jgi:hypothetical protein
MSVQAIITTPPDTMNIAGISNWRGSGWDSTVGEGDSEIVKYLWSFGDGTFGMGPEVIKQFSTPGDKTITLTVIGDNNSTHSTTVTVKVSSFQGKLFFVSSSTGSDNNPGTIDRPIKSIDKAMQISSNLKQNAPDAIFFKRGDSWDIPFDFTPNAPSIWVAYGSGADPIINMSSEFYSVEDHHGVPKDWGYSVYLGNIQFKWSTRREVGVTLGIRGSQMVACFVENGSVGNNGTIKVTVKNSTIKAAASNGYFSSGDWAAVIGCKFLGCGSDGYYQHSIYHSNNTHVLVGRTVCDGTGGNPSMGVKFSGSRKVYMFDVDTSHSAYGFDIGSNGKSDGSREGQDYLIERCIIHDNGIDNGACGGMWFTYCDRVLVRNCLMYNLDRFTSQAGLMFMGVAPDQLTKQVRIENLTIASNRTKDIIVLHDVIGPIKLRNTLFYRDTTKDGNFITVDSSNNGQVILDSDYNLFFATDAQEDTVGLFSLPGNNYSFNSWKAISDKNSKWGDPMFIDPTKDFHLKVGSPAINAGKNLPEIFDDLERKDRSKVPPVDIGALEFIQ